MKMSFIITPSISSAQGKENKFKRVGVISTNEAPLMTVPFFTSAPLIHNMPKGACSKDGEAGSFGKRIGRK